MAEGEFMNPKDLDSFIMEAMQVLREVLVTGEKEESPGGLAYRHEVFFRAFLNQFMAMYAAHRGQRIETFQLVRLNGDECMYECAIDPEAAYRESGDPDSVPNSLNRIVKETNRNIRELNNAAQKRSMWGGLRKPRGPFTFSGGRA